MFQRSRVIVSATLASVLLLLLSGAASSLFMPAGSNAATAQCVDGFDNDGDGRTDFPADPDCVNSDDNDEYGSSAAILLSISDGKDRVAPNGSVIYVVTVSTNDNFSQTTNVEVVIPSDVSISSASGGGSVTGQVIRWNNAVVSRGAPLTFTVQGTVSSRAAVGSTLVANASAGGRQTSDTTQVYAAGTVNSAPTFDISISDGETSVLPDEELDYVITVENLENIAATVDVRVSLSPYLAFVDPVDETDYDSSRILWQAQRFAPNEERTYRFSASAIERSNRNEVIRVSASVPGSVDTDSTTIRSSVTPHDLDIQISDSKAQTTYGELLTYIVSVENNEGGTVSDAFVSAALPIYAEFVSVQDGGTYDGGNVRWRSLDIAGDSTRSVSFTVRVRNDAPLGTDLLASASVDGMTDFDRTTVVERSALPSSRSSSATTRSSRSRTVTNSSVGTLPPAPTATASARPVATGNRTIVAQAGTVALPSQNVLLQKTADKREVLPGGVVRFRIIINNITGTTLRNLTVNDRFNASQFSVAEKGSAAVTAEGTLEWSVPTLEPGDTWSATYTLRASESLASGTTLSNLVALNGEGLDSVALDRRLSATKVLIVSTLPATGAPMDMFYLAILGSISIVPVVAQKKLKRS